MRGKWELPFFVESEITPAVSRLFDIIREMKEELEKQRDEIARLKGLKGKPKIKPSGMDKGTSDKKDGGGKRPGSEKRSKTETLEIDDTVVIHPENIPEGSIFKGYSDFVVQDLEIKKKNTLYRLALYKTADGVLSGQLPKAIDGHFGAELKSYILYQYHQCHVTEPLILEELREFGIDISSGQLNNILIYGHEDLHSEKQDILRAGLSVSSYASVDDTGARHKGENGVCTQIGNDLFAWFETTESKSRLNILTLLCAGVVTYFINDYSLSYIRKKHGLFGAADALKKQCYKKPIATKTEWELQLDHCCVRGKEARLAITEAALLGYLTEQGLPPQFVILSDDAGQFNILLHALCWVHAERHVYRLVGNTSDEKIAIEKVRGEIWDFYRDLKEYKRSPNLEKSPILEKRFDDIFTQKTCYKALNAVLERLNKNKNELLLVLQRPDVPLNTNGSETDIREYAKRRKISGSTRSDDGKRSRDTFTSLKKTCRKLGVSFWAFLNDRSTQANKIPALAELIRIKAGEMVLASDS